MMDDKGGIKEKGMDIGLESGGTVMVHFCCLIHTTTDRGSYNFNPSFLHYDSHASVP